jgi:adenosylhomocysteine nucleosidase
MSRRHVLLSSAMLLAAASLAPASSAEPAGRLDPRPRTVVMSAFPPELTALAGRTEIDRKVSVDGVEITLGRLAGQDVALVLSGISMVNAAMTTQLVLDHLDARAIVFSGIAGGVNPDLRIGDVVVPRRWGQYLEAVLARQVGDDYRLPAYAKQTFPNFGMIFPQEVTVRSERHPEGESRFWFDVDPGMLAAAGAIKGKVEGGLRRCAAEDQCLNQPPRVDIGGSGVSGMAFVDNKAFREYAYATFRADVLDMESAAVATVATANATPFLVFRSLSDLAGGGPGENEEGTFFQLAADNSAAAVTTFLATWHPEN